MSYIYHKSKHFFLSLADPTVSIFSSQSVFAGQLYSLNCTVTIEVGTLNIKWLDNNGNDLVEGRGISLYLDTISETVQRYDLIFNLLKYSDIGLYTCQASLRIDGDSSIVFNRSGSANETVAVKGRQEFHLHMYY